MKNKKTIFISLLILIILAVGGYFAVQNTGIYQGEAEHITGIYFGDGGYINQNDRIRYGYNFERRCDLGMAFNFDKPKETKELPKNTFNRGNMVYYYPGKTKIAGEEINFEWLEYSGFVYGGVGSSCSSDKQYRIQVKINGKKYCLKETEDYYSKESCGRLVEGKMPCDEDAIDVTDTEKIPINDYLSISFKYDRCQGVHKEFVGIYCMEIIPEFNNGADIEVISQPQLIKGYNNTLDIKINNRLEENDYLVIVTSNFDTPLGKISWQEEKTYNLKKGENIIEFPLTNITSIGQIDFDVGLYALSDGVDMITRSYSTARDLREFKQEAINYFGSIEEEGSDLDYGVGVNAEYERYDGRRQSGSIKRDRAVYYQIGKNKVKTQIEETTFTALISNMPVYSGEICNNNIDCKSGYSCMETENEDGLCVLTEVYEKETPCQVLGCPTFDIDGKKVTYECNANGFCSQVIIAKQECEVNTYFDKETNETVIVDSCGDGLKCDINNDVCVDEVLFNQMLSCEEASDCPTLCQGQTISCIAGRCLYEGECKTLEQQTCETLGCAEGYECINGNCRKQNKFNWKYLLWGLLLIPIIYLIRKGGKKK